MSVANCSRWTKTGALEFLNQSADGAFLSAFVGRTGKLRAETKLSQERLGEFVDVIAAEDGDELDHEVQAGFAMIVGQAGEPARVAHVESALDALDDGINEVRISARVDPLLAEGGESALRLLAHGDGLAETEVEHDSRLLCG